MREGKDVCLRERKREQPARRVDVFNDCGVDTEAKGRRCVDNSPSSISSLMHSFIFPRVQLTNTKKCIY